MTHRAHNDHEIRIYVDAALYVALQAEAENLPIGVGMILSGKTADLLPFLARLKPRLQRRSRVRLSRDVARFITRDLLRRRRLWGRG